MNFEKQVEQKVKGLPLGKIILGVIGVGLVASSIYFTPEGHVSIKKRFGKAISAEAPGLHFKIPFVEDIENMEVRTRKYSLELSASTTGINEDTKEVELQMPSQVKISANWNIPVNAALEIYKKYGGLEQYEDRILDPRVTRATKQVFAKHSIEKVVSEREVVRGQIEGALTDALTGKLATMTDINIEDVNWSPKIRKAVEDKQTAKLEFETESYNLDKQNLTAQRDVNTADAKAKGIEKISIAKAAAITREGTATASAMRDKAAVLAKNPHLIELIKAENWDGALSLVNGGGNGMFMQMDSAVLGKVTEMKAQLAAAKEKENDPTR